MSESEFERGWNAAIEAAARTCHDRAVHNRDYHRRYKVAMESEECRDAIRALQPDEAAMRDYAELFAEHTNVTDSVVRLSAAFTAAQADVARKDEALRPFAEAWDAAKNVDWVYSRGEAAVFCRNQVNAGHFEKARAALAPAHGAPAHD